MAVSFGKFRFVSYCALLVAACGGRSSLFGGPDDGREPVENGRAGEMPPAVAGSDQGGVTGAAGASSPRIPLAGAPAAGGASGAGVGAAAGALIQAGDGGVEQGGAFGQGGAGDAGAAGTIDPGPQPITVVAGGLHSCALRAGKVRCWGYGANGQLGYGNQNSIGGNGDTPSSAGDVDVGGVVTAVALGGSHTCAVLEGGKLRCWGFGLRGQLGYGNTEQIGDDETPALAGDVDVGGPVSRVAAGAIHTCVLLENGAVRCFGDNSNGQLGYGHSEDIGDDESPSEAGDVDIGAEVLDLRANAFHTCALLAGGKLRCWGNNSYGQLGYGHTLNVGDTESPSDAGDVDVGGSVVDVALGQYHSCALLEGGSVRCWSTSLGFGLLGDAKVTSTVPSWLPSSLPLVDVGGVVTALRAGWSHTCAVLEGGSVRCWGQGSQGALGYGNTNHVGDDEFASAAGDVAVGGSVLSLTCGGYHNCVELAAGHRCWGGGGFSQLGYGNTETIGDDETPDSVGLVELY